jgi:hypothetical protein
MRELPFDFKRRFCETYGMEIGDVKVMFRSPWSLELFTKIVGTLKMDPNAVY